MSALQALTTASATNAQAIAAATVGARAARIPTYSRQLLGGLTDTHARDIASLLLAVKTLTAGPDIVLAVLSALAMGCDQQTLSSSTVGLTLPTAEGVASVRAISPTNRVANQTFVTGSVDLAPLCPKTSSLEGPTMADAAGMVAMAVYAIGKQPTDTNQDGFLGGASADKGRVKALKGSIGATDLYLTGARSLGLGDLKKIFSAFGANPAGRHAVFGLVSASLVRPLTTVEQAVTGQARLLRTEGRGSFDRAVSAAMAFGPALEVMPAYRREMMALVRCLNVLSAEPLQQQWFGYILDKDAYDTLRVAQFPKLAQMGKFMLVDTGLASASNIADPIADATARGAVKTVYDTVNV